MKKVDLYHLMQTALHCIHISSWELLGLREMVKPGFVLLMNGCWQSLSVTCRADRRGKRGSYWYSNIIYCLDGFDRTEWAVVTHLWVSNLARSRWRCVYVDTSQKLWWDGSGTSFSEWEHLVVATLVNVSIGFVREVLLGNVPGRKIFSAFLAWARGVGDLIHYSRLQFIVLSLIWEKRGPSGWNQLVVMGTVVLKQPEMAEPWKDCAAAASAFCFV